MAVGACDNDPVYDYAKDAKLYVYGLKESKEASTLIYNTDNQIVLQIKAFRDNAGYKIQVTGDTSYEIILVHAGAPVEVMGALYRMDGDNLILSAEGSREILVK